VGAEEERGTWRVDRWTREEGGGGILAIIQASIKGTVSRDIYLFAELGKSDILIIRYSNRRKIISPVVIVR
jgi:hypothetical protein